MKPYAKPEIVKHEPLSVISGSTSGDQFEEAGCKGTKCGGNFSYWY